MNRESEVCALLTANNAVTAILTGGIYAAGLLTPEGITRELTEDAFDANGVLLPLAIVRQRSTNPTWQVVDYDLKVMSVRTMIEVWLYQAIDYQQLDAVTPLVYTTLHGQVLADSFELSFAFLLDRQRDSGALMDASLVRVDFQLDAIFAGA